MEDLKKRKTTRLKGADYNSEGLYFITVCTKNRRCILSQIVGTVGDAGPYNAKYDRCPIFIDI